MIVKSLETQWSGDCPAPNPIELIHATTVQDRNAWRQIAVGLVDAIRAGDEGRRERLCKVVDVHADQTVRWDESTLLAECEQRGWVVYQDRPRMRIAALREDDLDSEQGASL